MNKRHFFWIIVLIATALRFYKIGTIHHMIGGSFGVESDRYRAIYNYSDIKPYSIRKTNNGSKK